jgi:hypothetical protein
MTQKHARPVGDTLDVPRIVDIDKDPLALSPSHYFGLEVQKRP